MNKIERMNISLDDFLQYLKTKWILILFCILLGSVLGIAAVGLNGEVIKIDPSEKYIELKEQEAYFLDYEANSLIMQMNSTNAFEGVIYLNSTAEKQTIKEYVFSDAIWENYDLDISVQYLRELISWSEGMDYVEIKIWHYDEEECTRLMEYLAKKIASFDQRLEISKSEVIESAEEEISESQTWVYNRLEDIQGQLEHEQAGAVIQIDFVKAAIAGSLLGSILSFAVFLIKFLFTKTLRSNGEIEYYSKAKLIGKKKKMKSLKGIPEVETEAFKRELSVLLAEEKKVILLNLSHEKLNINDIEEISVQQLQKGEFEEILNYDKILLAAAPNETLYVDMKKLLEFLSEYEKEICGCIAC